MVHIKMYNTLRLQREIEEKKTCLVFSIFLLSFENLLKQLIFNCIIIPVQGFLADNNIF